MKRKTILLIAVVLFFHLQMFSQDDGWNNRVIIGNDYNTTEIARVSISFTNGFTTKDSDKSLNAYIDANIPIGGYTAVNNLQKYEVSCFPNPANDYLQIVVPETCECTIYIYNNCGKLQQTQTFYKETNINVSTLGAGIYFYQIQMSNGNNISGKWLKN